MEKKGTYYITYNIYDTVTFVAHFKIAKCSHDELFYFLFLPHVLREYSHQSIADYYWEGDL